MNDALNPAAKLYERLKEWQTLPERNTPKRFRTVEGRGWIDVHLETLGWFSQVRERFAGAGYAQLVDALASVIFTSDVGISGSRNGTVTMIDDQSLLSLKVLADNWGQPAIDPADLAGLGEVTAGIRALIESAGYLDAEATRYLFELLEAIDKAIDEFTIFGTGGVQRLANELISALLLFFGGQDVPADDAKKAGGFAHKLFSLAKKLARFSAKTATEVGLEFALKMLTAGPQ
ncbi:hypothetical protein PACID_15810 [Acidipropionibacterium acidipropionici ATCC 4875]|jgi:hypothetical protein|uniref:Uncharacterized protein n=1 Tax=Acidipropionibacterium acidipropionici (strain ATCC 4875 / DSM 20272 / JCM 6432 / NBRC 12425 / NCIMB 8070 / 4) TaxID=1171373 RepID=K7RN75_ACIA4|nr:hypothetical protein [Acidipropionibacterium acidipropionici]AFV89394.1 hypothetical protein PACID_15810 [Acidipropionibacterium acidipropionici ATCC 4875]